MSGGESRSRGVKSGKDKSNRRRDEKKGAMARCGIKREPGTEPNETRTCFTLSKIDST
jgi:hypothetical protein